MGLVQYTKPLTWHGVYTTALNPHLARGLHYCTKPIGKAPVTVWAPAHQVMGSPVVMGTPVVMGITPVVMGHSCSHGHHPMSQGAPHESGGTPAVMGITP